MSDRIIEVFAGAYASGKSETSLNRARQFSAAGKPVTLVDLDSVEPAYTLRPIAGELREMGINVITQPDNFGLGEAASYVTPAQINCLAQDGDIIIDVGYGAGGLDILDILTGIGEEENLQIYLVVNTAKFETSTVDNIIEYVEFTRGTGKFSFTGLISNTHFGDETTKEDIINAVSAYEPRIDMQPSDITIVADKTTVKIYIQYTIKSTGQINEYNMEITADDNPYRI